MKQIQLEKRKKETNKMRTTCSLAYMLRNKRTKEKIKDMKWNRYNSKKERKKRTKWELRARWHICYEI